MGVKSTQVITREDAESRYVYMMQDKMERQLKGIAKMMTDEDLENHIESLNDEVNDGEGFENYRIKRGE